jgi:glutamyl-tRNA synthetase
VSPAAPVSTPATVLRGRYAPSPTGELHLGNASTALLAWLSVRARGGRFVLRVEDLDPRRSRPALVPRILSDLVWLGLDWDEGPDRGGDCGPYDQASRRASHRAALKRLIDAGRVYPCFCSRRDVAAAASAPHGPGDEPRYAGTCRGLDPGEARRRLAAGARHAFRFGDEAGDGERFTDLVRGPQAPGPCGDFVVFRSDGVPAYQLAVVVDDAAMRITEVVRGADLLDSTPRQLRLFRALDLTPPAFGHVPLLLGPDGVRLSKRHRGITLRELRESGWGSAALLGRLALALGLRSDPGPVRAAQLLEGFAVERLKGVPPEIVVDPATWKHDVTMGGP